MEANLNDLVLSDRCGRSKEKTITSFGSRGLARAGGATVKGTAKVAGKRPMSLLMLPIETIMFALPSKTAHH